MCLQSEFLDFGQNASISQPSLNIFKISGSVKLHIGDLLGKLKTLVQFQHSSVMTFLHLDIYVWVPFNTPLSSVELQHSSMMIFFVMILIKFRTLCRANGSINCGTNEGKNSFKSR